MLLTEILPKLSGVKKASGGFVAKCPAHDDAKQSLSLKEAGGKVLLKCFAGCDISSVVATLGLELKDLFLETMSAQRNIDFPAKKITAIYDYRDENGAVLYQNIRYQPKDFRQRRPDGMGGYDYSLKGVRRVPYRLPELITGVSQGAGVWLCEGEKDADNMRQLGLTASSFKNWQAEFNCHLQNAHVVVLPDHDEAGQKQAADACRKLAGGVASLKAVDLFQGESLPGKHGKDVSDYIAACVSDEGLSPEEIAERLCLLAGYAEAWQSDAQTADNEPAEEFASLFTIQPANAWLEAAKLRPVPKMLFGELWFEGELCILFADTGKGKSILAVQIADAISKGFAIGNFALEATRQTILYFDFELSDKQFEARYSTRQGDYFTNHYAFDENFKRGEIDQNSLVPAGFKDFESFLNFSLEYEIVRTGAKVLIVDNITYLKNATETAKDALPLMKELIRLKKKHSLSILALAHTPKRDLARPLTVNDLQGSKMLSNFADSIFAIGESAKDKNLRYLKQIKARNTETTYDADNVATCQVIKPDNFLRFEFMALGNEREHLKVMSDNDKTDVIVKVKMLSGQGRSQRSIANELGLSVGTVNNYLKK